MAMETFTAEQFRHEFCGDLKLPATENRKVSKSDRTKLEDAFIAAWLPIGHGLPLPKPQYRFHHKRKWRFDFAFPLIKVAVELQGGGFVKGGHVRGVQQEKDFEKLREAQKLGWIVLQYGTLAMKNPIAVAAEVAEVLRTKLQEISP